MRNTIISKIRAFFSRPDWMLRKEVFIIILCIPIFYVFIMVVFTTSSISNLKSLESEVVHLEKLLQNLGKQKNKDLANKEKSYIEKFIEPMKFLSSDRKQLALLCSQVEDKDLYSGIKQRLSFLQSGENTLRFVSTEHNNEILWNLKKPVEMSCIDIKKLITLVEGKAIEPFYPNPYRPNIYFSKLQFKRINKGSADVFTVDMQILQKR